MGKPVRLQSGFETALVTLRRSCPCRILALPLPHIFKIVIYYAYQQREPTTHYLFKT